MTPATLIVLMFTKVASNLQLNAINTRNFGKFYGMIQMLPQQLLHQGSSPEFFFFH